MKPIGPILSLIFCLANLSALAQTPLRNAHAHNDYEHERPLLDALDQGFVSIEADVYLVEGQLYVYHFLPDSIDSTRTLEELYLKPLLARTQQNNGRVYTGYSDFLYLMIDFKTNGDSTYQTLKPLLIKYESIISAVRDGQEETDKPVKIFISGNRPVDQILNEEIALAALDGRAKDLGKEIPASLMPVVSQSMLNYTLWRGAGRMRESDQNRIKRLVENAHKEGKKVRLWASPNSGVVWRKLLDLGVDLISVDKLGKFSEFMKGRK